MFSAFASQIFGDLSHVTVPCNASCLRLVHDLASHSSIKCLPFAGRLASTAVTDIDVLVKVVAAFQVDENSMRLPGNKHVSAEVTLPKYVLTVRAHF